MNVRYWTKADIGGVLGRDRLSANDPKRTLGNVTPHPFRDAGLSWYDASSETSGEAMRRRNLGVKRTSWGHALMSAF